MQQGDGTLWLVAANNVVVALISLASVRALPETQGRDLNADQTSADVGRRRELANA